MTANPSFEKTCRNCGHCEGDDRNPAKMGVCYDVDNIRASPVGKREKVVRLWQTCSNWTPRNCDNCFLTGSKLCDVCKDTKFWACKEAF